MLVESMECRGSCIFRRLALELRCFREPLPSLRMLEARAFDLRSHLAMVPKSARKSCTPFGGPRRSHLSTLTTCSTHELASSCARFRAHPRATCSVVRKKLSPSARSRSRTCPVTPLLSLQHSRTHPLRAFIFSVLSSRKFGVLVSKIAVLLELLNLPTRPPGTRTLQLSPQLPRARKISPTRLAALPTQ
jgi:hypothetical protein